jgi:hypothetical protein
MEQILRYFMQKDLDETERSDEDEEVVETHHHHHEAVEATDFLRTFSKPNRWLTTRGSS